MEIDAKKILGLNSNKCGIYIIRNQINGNIYIGQSRNIDKRWSKHISDLSLNRYPCSPLYNAFRKYGVENFILVSIELCSIEELNEREIFYVKKYNSMVPNGYNLTSGGGQNTFLSKESIKRISEANTGEKNGFYGKKHSEESKRKMSKIKIGKKHTKESRLKMIECKSGDKHPFYGKKHSEESKREIKESKTGSNNPLFGKHHSEETKRKIKEAQTGDKNHRFGKDTPNETRIKISRASMHGKKIKCSNGKIYLSRIEASEDTGVGKYSISYFLY